MELISTVLDAVQSPAFAGVMAGLWVVSESLAAIPSIKANSVFQLVQSFLERFKRD